MTFRTIKAWQGDKWGRSRVLEYRVVGRHLYIYSQLFDLFTRMQKRKHGLWHIFKLYLFYEIFKGYANIYLSMHHKNCIATSSNAERIIETLAISYFFLLLIDSFHLLRWHLLFIINVNCFYEKHQVDRRLQTDNPSLFQVITLSTTSLVDLLNGVKCFGPRYNWLLIIP